MNAPEQHAPEVSSPSSLIPSGPEGESLFRQIAETIPQLVWTTRPDGYHDYFNQRWYDYTGRKPGDTDGEGWQLPFHPEDVPEAQRRWQHSLRTGEPYDVEYRCRRHDGVYRWFIGRAQPVRDAEGRVVKWFGTCTDIEDQKRAVDALQVLAEASSLLASSPLDYEATLDALTKLAVPRLADWCTLRMVGEHGMVQLFGVAHVAPEKVALAWELSRRYPPDPKASSGVYEVIRTGRSDWLPTFSEEALAKLTRDAEHLRIVRELGLRSSVTVPLKARGRVLGALQLISAESNRIFSAADVALFEQIAERAALAVDNARLYREAQVALRRKEEEQRVAETLHRMGLLLASELEPVRLIKSVTEAGVSLTGASFGAFLEKRVEEHGEPSRLSTLPLPRGTPLFAPTFRGDPPLLLDDVTRHPEYGKSSPFQSLSAKHLPVRSFLGVPVKGRSGEVLGGLFFVHPEPARFTRVHAQLAEGIAAQAAVALDNARLYASARQAEERFRSLINATAQAVWVTRPDGLALEDSPSWREFTGQTYEEYRGFGWLGAVHPDDQERVRRGWEAGRALKRPYEVEMRVRRKDGSHATILSRAVPLYSAPGEVREWVGTSLDVTAQRSAEESSRRLESEQRTRQLEALHARVSEVLSQEVSPERMMQECAEVMTRCLPMFPLSQLWAWDREAKVLRLKGHAGPSIPPSIQMDRLEPGQGVAGRVGQSRQLLHSNDALRHPGVARARDWLEAQGLTSFVGIPLQVRGQLVGVFTLFGMQPLEEETLITLSTVAEALSQGLERRRAELALQAHATELARSNEELQQFAYVASHDLQEPLRMVASFTQLLARRYKGRLDSDADEFIAFAVDGVTRMQRLIQDLLAYSRVGTKGHEFKPVEAGPALDKALANLKTLVDETGASITQGPLPRVMADESQLTQLFQNLVGNALKFRGPKPTRIRVDAERQGDSWRFTVSDNGIGIEPQYFERIFIIFQRLHNKEDYPGTGIGLAICKKIVERHGGRIGLESYPGQGSVFWFTLPVLPSLPVNKGSSS
ncbi:Phytochrome, two-component sensor histidine kinase [Cystobacter fuscus DSM 2262]|uniref:histidine kinase n=1 Tax=Cystobacter fuscus (strain ATCC 25194 / DSM 2262 / NBRC 100088 / M29) TaxID=1242864 RepID=S9P702_CYSF2|nr:GAF domain-containing protein [Cystobacter fuscus]EPX60230.1 Phytochrome, two-component sensor histidine kinase [Cystobacter fuscus DSM 2262]